MSDSANISEEVFMSSGAVQQMTDDEFALFSKLIYSRLGIKMPPVKKLMLTSRLVKRIRELGFASYKQYYDFICSDRGKFEELNKMIDAVTTNKTDFFREPDHFEVLAKMVLPEIIESKNFKENKAVNVWSAGCSTGEEAYTLTMVMAEFFSGNLNKFNILATDISGRVLQAGCEAVYSENAIQPIPITMKHKYIMRGTGNKAGLFRVVPELRQKVTFRQVNLMDSRFDIRTDMDIIFCRNVIIYFDKETQIKLFKKFYNHLIPGGYLFIGSSESLYGVNDDFVSIRPTVYIKPSD